MPEYLVSWEINVEADDPVAAAKEAAEVQAVQTTESGNGGVFTVTDENGNSTQVDLQEEDNAD